MLSPRRSDTARHLPAKAFGWHCSAKAAKQAAGHPAGAWCPSGSRDGRSSAHLTPATLLTDTIFSASRSASCSDTWTPDSSAFTYILTVGTCMEHGYLLMQRVQHWPCGLPRTKLSSKPCSHRKDSAGTNAHFCQIADPTSCFFSSTRTRDSRPCRTWDGRWFTVHGKRGGDGWALQAQRTGVT